MRMHWIIVGILIWVGLAIAPAVIGLAVYLLPGAFFGLIVGLIGISMTGTFLGFFWGAIIGAIAPYVIMNWSETAGDH